MKVVYSSKKFSSFKAEWFKKISLLLQGNDTTLNPRALRSSPRDETLLMEVNTLHSNAIVPKILRVVDSTMKSILSVFNGRWLPPTEECDLLLLKNELENDNSQLDNIIQPSPPRVLPQLKPELLPISPSIVADPRIGPSKLSQDGLRNFDSFHDLHIPLKKKNFVNVSTCFYFV
ncbi:MPN domain-containing protein [Forsythia ovata]|uniref:MPN domain-containing protein n=1 Tax=Forsythia ovata TaxID=205694 RepID=A0ABD1SP12_9LAMI